MKIFWSWLGGLNMQDVRDTFHGLFLLITYPVYGCVWWLWHIHKHAVPGKKYYLCLSLLGLISWGLAILAIWLPQTMRWYDLALAAVMYVTGGIIFIIVTAQKAKEVAEKQKILPPAEKANLTTAEANNGFAI